MVGGLKWLVDEPARETPDGSRPGDSLSQMVSAQATTIDCVRTWVGARFRPAGFRRARRWQPREGVGATCTQVSTSKRRFGGDPLHFLLATVGVKAPGSVLTCAGDRGPAPVGAGQSRRAAIPPIGGALSEYRVSYGEPGSESPRQPEAGGSELGGF